MKLMKLIAPFLILASLLSACNTEKKEPKELTFQDAYKELLLLGVEVRVDFESIETLSINGHFHEVPCVKLQKYEFFAVKETPKVISDIIVAVKNLNLAIKKEIEDEEYGYCINESGYKIGDILLELQECKAVLENGGNCF